MYTQFYNDISSGQNIRFWTILYCIQCIWVMRPDQGMSKNCVRTWVCSKTVILLFCIFKSMIGTDMTYIILALISI